MPELTIIATPSSSILTVSFPLEATVGELKLALKALLDGEAERMVCGGRVLREDRTLQEQGKRLLSGCLRDGDWIARILFSLP